MSLPSGLRLPVARRGAGNVPETPETIIKLMSLDAGEFRRSLVKFAPQTRDQGKVNDYLIGDKSRGLRIHVEELEPFCPGGLIVLPQCRITLEFHGLAAQERNSVLTRFERSFFRGGG